MKQVANRRFEWRLAALLLTLWLALWLWQNPGLWGGRIGTDEAARYLAAVEKLPMPPEERAGMLARLSTWMAQDDGRPVYMLNLMRFYPELRRLPGAPAYNGSPRESNQHYEDLAMPMVFKVGAYPVYAGNMDGKNLLEHRAELDDWNRLLVVRYPNRRAFMDLVSNPEYAKIVPYKLMALSIVLSPTASELVIPELPLVAGALFVALFLALGWWRACRRAGV